MAGSMTPARDESLVSRIEDISSKAPRFLFRVWSAVSGGNAALNTVTAITPVAFLDSNQNNSIHDISRRELSEFISDHVQNINVPTIFSSWSQSLAFVLCWAREKALDGHLNIHISVLDTKRLPPDNVVLYSPALSFLYDSMTAFRYEYLVFGVIPAPLHQAVPYTALVSKGLRRLCPPDMANDYFFEPEEAFTGRTSDLARDMAIAQGIATHFSGHFKVAVLVYIVTMSKREPGELARLVREFDVSLVPEEWQNDATVGSDGLALGGVEEAERAVSLLQALVKKVITKAAATPEALRRVKR